MTNNHYRFHNREIGIAHDTIRGKPVSNRIVGILGGLVRPILLSSLSALLFSAFASAQNTVIETMAVVPLTPTGSLSTCSYRPTDLERPFYNKLGKKELATGSFMEPYSIYGKSGKYVSWYGIVRGVRQVPGKDNSYELLLEHKYFDGMTDCHIMLVSESGGGDFNALLSSKEGTIPALALVRVYGTVIKENGGDPYVQAQYIRVWPWFTFTFTDLGGDDKTNPLWKKVCKPCENGGRIYNPYPTEQYYDAILGDPKDYGLMLPSSDWPK